jgi:uncharacterized protein involved in exopolysaccharide biosynthesis
MADFQEQRRETTIRDFLNVVFRRKWMILSIVATATAVVVFLNARQPIQYASSSRVLVKRGQRSDVISGRVLYLSWEEEISSQLEIILSEAVFSEARKILADSLRARGIEATFNPGEVRADVIGESNVITISYADLNPVVARLGCAAVTEAYSRYYRRRTEIPGLSDFFSSQISETAKELEYWRNKKKEFLDQEQFFGASEEARYLMNQLSQLQMSVAKLESDISSQAARVANLEQLAALPPDQLESRLSFTSTSQVILSSVVTHIKYNLQNLRNAGSFWGDTPSVTRKSGRSMNRFRTS